MDTYLVFAMTTKTIITPATVAICAHTAFFFFFSYIDEGVNVDVDMSVCGL